MPEMTPVAHISIETESGASPCHILAASASSSVRYWRFDPHRFLRSLRLLAISEQLPRCFDSAPAVSHDQLPRGQILQIPIPGRPLKIHQIAYRVPINRLGVFVGDNAQDFRFTLRQLGEPVSE